MLRGQAGACSFGGGSVHAATPGEPLRTVREVLARAPDALAQKPVVRLRGLVTYFKAEAFSDLVIQDKSGGVFINNATGTVTRTLQPGAIVEVEGTASCGNFSPRVDARRITFEGTITLPSPAHVSFDDLKSGRFDCRYVEAAGVVRAATVDNSLTPPRLILRVAMPAGQFYAWVLRFGDDDGQRFIDAAVRVRGVCLAWENARRQFTSLRLLVNNLDAITVTRAPPADPFAAPLVTADTLLRYQPDGIDAHRVRLRGVVTWWRPGDYLVIQDTNFGLRVNSDALEPLKLGDAVEVAGFPALMGYSAGLQDAVYRVVEHPGEPAARAIEAKRFLSDQWTIDTDLKLVRLAGTLRGVQRSGWEIILAMEEAGANFAALLQHGDDTRWAEELEPGSRLQLKGVCDVRPSDRRRMVGGTPDGFALLLRGRGDVTVLRAGPWLTQRRLLVILAVSGGALILALAWAFTLRRRVEQRTAHLAREIRTRHDAEVEFNATLGERKRIAAELHDTLQQTLTGVALQLAAAGLAARQSAQPTPPHVETARELLERSREELRRSVWNLRQNNGGAPTDLVAELRELAQSMSLGGNLSVEVKSTGSPRPLTKLIANHSLRIAQESLTNAVKHGRAKNIIIAVEFAESVLTLRITDDGAGFTPAAAPGAGTGHFGLHGMRERAVRLGGALIIESAPGQRTTIILKAPL